MSLRSSILRKSRYVSTPSSLASLVAKSICGWKTSQSATICASGFLINVFITPRPCRPGPITPTRTRSFAPRMFPPAAAAAPTVATPRLMKSLRSILLFIFSSFNCWHGTYRTHGTYGTDRTDVAHCLLFPLSPCLLVSLSFLRLQHADLQMRREFRRTIDPLRGLLEVLVLRLIDVHELLRIAINQREPCALDVDHYPMALLECVIDVGHREGNVSSFARLHRLRLRPTLAVLRAHRLATHQHLIAVHRIGLFFGEDVDQLDDEVGVRARSRSVEVG